MNRRKILSLLLIALLTVFAVPQYATKAEAASTHYQRALSQYEVVYNVTDYGVNTKSDIGAPITSLVKKLAKARTDESTPIALYLPSGKYKLSTAIKLNTYPNIHLIAENDTVVTSSKTVRGMIEIQNTSNISVLGGKWDGNNKTTYIMKLYKAKDVDISQVSVTKAKERGIHVSASNATISGVKAYSNKKYGVSATQQGKITLLNSQVYKNNMHGICIVDSVLHMENGNNKVYKNGYSGISVTGKKGKIYVSYNEFTQNGTKNDSRGHGIGISDYSYGEVTNNVLKSNKQCGIALTNHSTSVIKNNTISSNSRHGIGAALNNKFTIEGNVINSNKWHGILNRDKGSGSIINNTINSNKVSGICVERATATINKNTISKNKSNGIYVVSSTVKLTDNKITKNKAFGIYMDKGKAQVISGNVITSNSKGDIDATGATLKLGKKNTVKKIKK